MPRESALDLYAGSGAMGIEALSRGIKEAHFVESDPKSAALIKKNLDTLDLSERAKVFKRDVDGFFSSFVRGRANYDLIFMDPPYNAGLTTATLKEVAASEAIAAGAIVVVEVGKHEPINDDDLERGFGNLEQIDFRKYGDSLIYIFKRNK